MVLPLTRHLLLRRLWNSVQPKDARMNSHSNTIVVSCEVFRHEIELITSQMENPPSIFFMEMGLHERPDRLRETIQIFVLEHEAKRMDEFTILLAYGLCGQGLTEITCTKATLVLPKVHDCIPLLLGIKQNEAGAHSLNGQTYWQSPGWVSYAHSELLRNKEAKYQEYLEKFGEDNARYLMEEQLSWLQHYQTVKLIKWSQIAQMETKAEKSSGFFEDEARCFAREAELPYSYCTGSDNYLRALLEGGNDRDLFLHIKPGFTAQLDADGALVTVELSSNAD